MIRRFRCHICNATPDVRGATEGVMLFKSDDRFFCPAHLPRDSERHKQALAQLLDPDTRAMLLKPVAEGAAQ